jgi:hypothetical protein
MPEYLATLYAALIGAVVGSGGAVIVENLFARHREESRKREVLVQRYLYQLQDAAESLQYRLKNLGERSQEWLAQQLSDYPAYLETTTLYALGRVLAVERMEACGILMDNLQVLHENGQAIESNCLCELDIASRCNIQFTKYLSSASTSF